MTPHQFLPRRPVCLGHAGPVAPKPSVCGRAGRAGPWTVRAGTPWAPDPCQRVSAAHGALPAGIPSHTSIRPQGTQPPLLEPTARLPEGAEGERTLPTTRTGRGLGPASLGSPAQVAGTAPRHGGQASQQGSSDTSGRASCLLPEPTQLLAGGRSKSGMAARLPGAGTGQPQHSRPPGAAGRPGPPSPPVRPAGARGHPEWGR